MGAETFSEALRAGAEVFHALKKLLKDAGHNTAVGDEGGFAPNVNSEQALAFIEKGIEAAGYKMGEDIVLGLDVASSEFFKDGRYHLEGEGQTLDAEGMVAVARGAVRAVPDRLGRGRHGRGRLGGLAAADRILGDEVQLVGDDLFVTNPAILTKGSRRASATPS